MDHLSVRMNTNAASSYKLGCIELNSTDSLFSFGILSRLFNSLSSNHQAHVGLTTSMIGESYFRQAI